MEKKGIDISYHQGDIDFEKLKGNIDFAMVRTSYGNFSQDKKHKEYINSLEKIGVPYGLYHFSYATSVEDAKQEAKNFIELTKNYNPTYPVVIDIEQSTRTANVNKDTLVNITSTICEMVEQAGYYVMIYANLDYLNNKLNSEKLDKYDKWLAEWRSNPTYNKEFGMWQYSSKGNVPGIKGNVDMDISYKDYPSIIKEKKLNNYKEKVQEKEEQKISFSDNLNYVVKKGNTLSGIANKYNTTYQNLANYNNIKDPNKIYPGQIIKIPSSSGLKPTTYIVKKGDTLEKIAKKYNTTWQKIYEKNKNIIGNNPNKIYPGQTLNI